mmetsp:Transcript_1356/g.2822  ORF Transcript_1356/g.2822 Transcript_1356/m.2822 type:complete len:379 (-) Transcript_1356:318-1454(-)
MGHNPNMYRPRASSCAATSTCTNGARPTSNSSCNSNCSSQSRRLRNRRIRPSSAGNAIKTMSSSNTSGDSISGNTNGGGDRLHGRADVTIDRPMAPPPPPSEQQPQQSKASRPSVPALRDADDSMCDSENVAPTEHHHKTQYQHQYQNYRDPSNYNGPDQRPHVMLPFGTSPMYHPPDPSRIIEIRSSRSSTVGGPNGGSSNNDTNNRYNNNVRNVQHRRYAYDEEEATTEDKRMYDLATWRMYHRIMDSRRRRQEEMLRGGGGGGGGGDDGDEYGSSTFFPPGFDPERHERMIRQAKSEADSVFRRTLLRSSTVNGRDDVDDDPDLHVLLPPSSGTNPSLCLTPGAGPESLVHMLARARRAGTEVAADYGDVFDIDM